MHTKLLQGLILAAVAASATAGVYKWTDADGNTHYSESPPPGDIDTQTLRTPSTVDTEAAHKRIEAQRKQARESAEQRAESKKQASESEREQTEKAEKCAAADRRLASYQRPRVNRTEADGSVRRIPEEERQTEIKRTQDYIAEFCN